MDHEKYAIRLAELLLQIKAVEINLHTPYTWASGWKSPIYCDNRRILARPDERDEIADMLAAVINNLYPGRHVILAGVATGAIGIGALAADRLRRPFVYVRPEPKKHGTGSQIECMQLDASHEVVVVEDLISTGKSSLQIADVVKQTGAKVLGMEALFTYGFPKAEKAFEQAGITLRTLSNYEILMQVAEERKLILSEQQTILQQWRLDPDNWDPKNNS